MNFRKFLVQTAIVSVLFISISYGIYLQQDYTDYLSEYSNLTFNELNQTYNMKVVDDLGDPTNNQSSFLASLFGFRKAKNINKGVILSFQQGIVLLEPGQPLSEGQLAGIAENYQNEIPEIMAAEVDQELGIEESDSHNFILPNITPKAKAQEPSPLPPLRIAVIDSGLASEHPVFKNTTILVNPVANTIKDSDDVSDDVSHGTHISGLIVNRTQNTVIMPYKVADRNGGRLSNLIKALNLALADRAELINLSLGVKESSYALEELIQTASEQGTVIVAAAGNFNTSQKFYPAGYEPVIAVGAVYASGVKTSKSNYGEWVDVAALGYQLNSSVPPSGYAQKSGTSQAAALITADVANYLQTHPEATLKELNQYLLLTEPKSKKHL